MINCRGYSVPVSYGGDCGDDDGGNHNGSGFDDDEGDGNDDGDVLAICQPLSKDFA